MDGHHTHPAGTGPHTHPAGSGPHTHPDPAVPAKPAVLELGADLGAAVIYTPAALDGKEIDIKPCDGEWNGAHTAVRKRPAGKDCPPQYAALFFGLTAGTYDLRLGDELRSLEVCGGRVTEQVW